MSAPDPRHPLDLLSAYLDGELDPEERARMEGHLAGCEACRGHLASLRALASAVASEAPPPVPEGMARRIGGAIDAAKVVPLRRRLAVPAALAATIAAVSLLVVYRWHEGRARAFREAPPAEAVTETAPAAPAAEGETLPAPPSIATPERGAGRRPSPRPPLGSVGNVEAKPKAAAERPLGEGPTPARSVPAYPTESESAPQAAAAPPPSTPAAAAEADSSVRAAPVTRRSLGPPPCPSGWTDAGAVATWDVPDMQGALRDLAAIAEGAGGRGDGAPVARGLPYEIVVPAERYAGLVKTLEARGVAGVPAAPAAAGGAACLRLRVSIRVVLGAP